MVQMGDMEEEGNLLKLFYQIFFGRIRELQEDISKEGHL